MAPSAEKSAPVFLHPSLPRREFIRLTALSGLWLAGGARVGAAFAEDAPSPVPAEFPRQAPDVVREIVGVSHGNLARVRELVTERPALAKATWDWGYGDWESALGAASHTGRREIAEFLLEHGARPDVFSAAMLGQLSVVKAFVEADAVVPSIPGPHGIPLIAHARAGGDPAKAVAAYLESLPAAPAAERPAELTDTERTALLGTYRYGTEKDEALDVTEREGRLQIARAGLNRGLTRVEGLSFHPAGAPDVRITFRMETGRAAVVTVHDGPLMVQALRTKDA
jgi:hypothetical protein